jgi:DNA-binding NarL/FixJ family response regulator
MQQERRAPVRLVIVADHPVAAETIRRGLRHASRCEVIGYLDCRRFDPAPVADAAPDVVLVDEPANAEVGLERIRALRAAAPAAKVILLSSRMEQEWLAEAAAAGIDAAVAKTSLDAVGVLVREVAVGHVFHSFGTAGPAPRERNDRAAQGLTARELEILGLVASGASNGRIARELWVTEQTVKFHLSNLYRKLGVANRTEASHFAHVNGLVEAAPREAAAALAVAA